MCNCPAHDKLMDCVCRCDHRDDRLRQWKSRALEAEYNLARIGDKLSELLGEVND